PLSSPLFPYTTLFRSAQGGRRRGLSLVLVPRRTGDRITDESDLGGDARAEVRSDHWQSLLVEVDPDLEPRSPLRRYCAEILREEDRKSTRLNSSHVSI